MSSRGEIQHTVQWLTELVPGNHEKLSSGSPVSVPTRNHTGTDTCTSDFLRLSGGESEEGYWGVGQRYDYLCPMTGTLQTYGDGDVPVP
jgi:hypothetical protein